MQFFVRIYNYRVFVPEHGFGWWIKPASVYSPLPFGWSLAIGWVKTVKIPLFMFVREK